MASGRWMILAALLWGPDLTFRYAKAQAMAKLSANDLAAIRCVLSAEVKRVPAAEVPGDRVSRVRDGWRFSLPAGDFRPSDDPNQPNVLESDRLAVHILGACSRTPQLKPQYRPTNDEALRYCRQTDPYQLLCDAFTMTPAGLEAAETHAELQKALHLLLLRSIVRPIGLEKQWLRLAVGGRRGFLAGDETCEPILVWLYLPETREFADVALHPKDGAAADMEDVYRCLGQLKIQREAAAEARPRPARAPALMSHITY